MPKRSVKGGSKHKKNVEFPKTPHGPVLGQGKKMKGGGFLGRLGGALLDSAPQMLLGAATDNPYLMAQGASTFAGRVADDDRYDVLNRGAAGDMTSALGQMRTWRGSRGASALEEEESEALPALERQRLRPVIPRGVSDKGIDDEAFSRARSRFDKTFPAGPIKPSFTTRARLGASKLADRAGSAARGFAARSRAAIDRARSRISTWQANRRARASLAAMEGPDELSRPLLPRAERVPDHSYFDGYDDNFHYGPVPKFR